MSRYRIVRIEPGRFRIAERFDIFTSYDWHLCIREIPVRYRHLITTLGNTDRLIAEFKRHKDAELVAASLEILRSS